MSIHRGDTNAAMVTDIDLNRYTLQTIADEVARSLSSASMHGNAIFITTAVNYPNGTSVVVRIDANGDDFFVSDDGQGEFCAELFGGSRQFNIAASPIAKNFYAEFDQGMFFRLKVKRNQLPTAVSHIANASAMAVDRALSALNKQKTKNNQDVFTARMREAFGEKAAFNIAVQGRTKEWDIAAAVMNNSEVTTVFDFVTPAHVSITTAYMKISDIAASIKRPRTAIVLSDYDKTDAAMRHILSTATDAIIAAKANSAQYLAVAAQP